MGTENLVAACGLFCGACEMYRAYKDNDRQKAAALLKMFNARGGNFTLEDIKCDGCLAGGKLTPWCLQCEMRLCARRKTSEARCSPDCHEFPCKTLTDFANDGMTHHKEIVDNLRRLKKSGLKKHAALEEKRWKCQQCRMPLSWYTRVCPKCGAPRQETLYEVTDLY